MVPMDSAKQSRECMMLRPKTGFTNEYMKCSYNWDTRNMTLTEGMRNNATQADPPTLEFSIPQWRNPRFMLNATDMFNITIFTKEGVLLYKYN